MSNYSVQTKTCPIGKASETLKSLLDDSELTTLLGLGITPISNSLVLCWIAYE